MEPFHGRVIDDDERQRLAGLKDGEGKPRFSPEELKPYSDKEKAGLLLTFNARRNKALPEGPIDFRSTDFLCIFSAAGFLFSDTVSFNGAIFSNWATFEGAIFSGAADFVGVTFSHFSLFFGATFSDSGDFDGVTFSDAANFAGVIFSSQAHFINTSFTGRTSFADCKFKTDPPDLRGADLHEASEWHGVTWPPIPENTEQAQAHLYAYEHLKKEMERLKKHEDEHVFFTRELRCREVIAGFPRHLVSRLYGGLSAYGWSILRPLQAMLALWAAGLMVLWPLGGPDYSALAQHTAMGLSFANLFALLPLRKEVFATTLETLSPLAHVVSAGQMLAGIVLLFLLGLALRNRFRMK